MLSEYIQTIDNNILEEQITHHLLGDGKNLARLCGADKVSVAEYIESPIGFIEGVKKKLLKPSYSGDSISSFTFTPFLRKKINRNNKTRVVGKSSINSFIAQVIILEYLKSHMPVPFYKNSYAYQSGFSAKGAVKNLARELQSSQYTQILDVDIKEFFDNVNHNILLELVRKNFPGDSLLELLIYRYLKTSYVAKLKHGKIRSLNRIGYESRQKGVPQGGVLSGFLSNLYLDEFDKCLVEEFKCAYIRYADDFVVLLSNDTAESLYNWISFYLKEKLDLVVHPLGTKSKILDVSAENSFVEYLGYRVFKKKILVSPKNIKKLKLIVSKNIQKSKENKMITVEKLVLKLNKLIEKESADSYNDSTGYTWSDYFDLISHRGQLKEFDNWLIKNLLKSSFNGVRYTAKDIYSSGLTPLCFPKRIKNRGCSNAKK